MFKELALIIQTTLIFGDAWKINLLSYLIPHTFQRRELLNLLISLRFESISVCFNFSAISRAHQSISDSEEFTIKKMGNALLQTAGDFNLLFISSI